MGRQPFILPAFACLTDGAVSIEQPGGSDELQLTLTSRHFFRLRQNESNLKTCVVAVFSVSSQLVSSIVGHIDTRRIFLLKSVTQHFIFCGIIGIIHRDTATLILLVGIGANIHISTVAIN
jgi:hypothetical protein